MHALKYFFIDLFNPIFYENLSYSVTQFPPFFCVHELKFTLYLFYALPSDKKNKSIKLIFVVCQQNIFGNIGLI